MQRLEVSGAVRPPYGSLGVKGLNCLLIFIITVKNKKSFFSSVKKLKIVLLLMHFLN